VQVQHLSCASWQLAFADVQRSPAQVSPGSCFARLQIFDALSQIESLSVQVLEHTSDEPGWHDGSVCVDIASGAGLHWLFGHGDMLAGAAGKPSLSRDSSICLVSSSICA